MAALTTHSYPPPLDDLESRRLAQAAKDWTIGNGLAVRLPLSAASADADPQDTLATSVPVTLFPSPFPKVCFGQARAVQETYNELYARISQDEEFLAQIVEE